MLYRHKDFQETLVHQCNDADRYTMAHKKEIANIRVHDMSVYLVVPVRDYRAKKINGEYPITGYETVTIKHCPYCGCLLERDKVSPDFLKMRLL